jgi:hypothetical protein
MKRILLLGSSLGTSALVLVGTAGAATPITVPTVPVSDYGDALLTGLASAVSNVFPYAAAITAFAIGVGLVRRWLGAKKATRV